LRVLTVGTYLIIFPGFGLIAVPIGALLLAGLRNWDGLYEFATPVAFAWIGIPAFVLSAIWPRPQAALIGLGGLAMLLLSWMMFLAYGHPLAVIIVSLPFLVLSGFHTVSLVSQIRRTARRD
jgi:hypothetical protein